VEETLLESGTVEDTAQTDEAAKNQRLEQKLRRLQRKSSKTPIFDLIQELKPIWEQLRLKRLDAPKRREMISTTWSMVQGHVKEVMPKYLHSHST
jgi:hypothetical protein